MPQPQVAAPSRSPRAATVRRLRLWWMLSPWLVLALATLFCFWGLTAHGVHMWDETRYGENAWQMLKTHDFLNYIYDGQPDDWVAKPPLGIWMIAASYKLVGFSELGLRLPSALSGIGIVMFTYFLVRLYRGPLTAGLVAFVLITCRGVISQHVSRTGDLDAVYIVTAMGTVYFLARYLKKGELWSALAMALMGGLCFYAKGFMFLMTLPALALFALTTRRVQSLLKDRLIWTGAAIIAAFIASWYALVKLYGQTFTGNLGHDAWDTMVTYDIWRRYTEKIEGNDTNAAFTLAALDTRFGPWIYLFYLMLAVLLVQNRHRLKAVWEGLRRDDLMALSAAFVLGITVVLSTSSTKFNWYYAIAVPFLAVLTVQLFRAAARRLPSLWYVAGLFAAAATGMQIYATTKREGTITDQIIEQESLIRGASHLYYQGELPLYNEVLALKWRGKTLEPMPPVLLADKVMPVTTQIALVTTDQPQDPYSLILTSKAPGPAK